MVAKRIPDRRRRDHLGGSGEAPCSLVRRRGGDLRRSDPREVAVESRSASSPITDVDYAVGSCSHCALAVDCSVVGSHPPTSRFELTPRGFERCTVTRAMDPECGVMNFTALQESLEVDDPSREDCQIYHR